MSTRPTRELPARLEGARRRFEGWRRRHQARSRIPDWLWASAVKMAGTYGLYRTAKALRLDYDSLKKRVEQQPSAAPGLPEKGAVARFLELAPPASADSCQCTWELEDAGGAKMRIHLKGIESPDLVAHQPELVGAAVMIQITPQMRIVVAVQPADFRRGIDGLARLCKEALRHDPFGGWVFVFRNRRSSSWTWTSWPRSCGVWRRRNSARTTAR